MTAAVITPTMVQKEEIGTQLISGSTERRLVRLYLEGPKAAADDWFLISTYIGTTDAANVVKISACTMDSGNNITLETACTYDRDDYKLDLASAAVGTTFAEVIYYTE